MDSGVVSVHSSGSNSPVCPGDKEKEVSDDDDDDDDKD